MTDTLTLLRQQFADLCAQRDAIQATSMPIRAERDALIRASETALKAQTDPLNAQIVAAESGLADIMNQIAQIANALNGQTAI